MLNQASAITATLVPQAFNKAWIENGTDLAKLDPGDPKINALKAKVTNDLANVYGLDVYSPGFIDKVLPVINKEWEQLQNRHFSANVKHKKHVKEIIAKKNQLFFDFSGQISIELNLKLFKNLLMIKNQAAVKGSKDNSFEKT